MSSLVVVTGPPGAGKSTVAQLIADRHPHSVLIEGDAFFAFLRTGRIEPWLPEANAQNTVITEAAGAAAGQLTRGGFLSVYDGIVGPWFLPTFAAATGLDHLDYVVLLPPVEVCIERVATRRGHGFSDESATRHMHEQFAHAEIDTKHLILDTSPDASAVAERVVAAQAADTLRYAIS